MVFKILDASAFYAGIPFGSSDRYYTTTLVLDEIQHIKKNYNALETLIQTKRLFIREPELNFVEKVRQKAQESGDIQELSKEDISILSLSLELKGELITDDFAVSNLAKNFKIKVSPIMTSGIKNVGKVGLLLCRMWKKIFQNFRLPTVRKFIKEKTTQGEILYHTTQ